MNRTVNGVRFLIHSPSHWELDASDSIVRKAELKFDGEWWNLEVTLPTHKVFRNFCTRQAALDLICARRPCA